MNPKPKPPHPLDSIGATMEDRMKEKMHEIFIALEKLDPNHELVFYVRYGRMLELE